jgi:hypothetical protein
MHVTTNLAQFGRAPSIRHRLASSLGIVRALFVGVFSALALLGTAHGSERAGDAAYVYALERHADAVAALEDDFLALIETAVNEERFNLYRSFNQLMGAWLQVDFLSALLDSSIAAVSPLDEEEMRTNLRDQAEFTLWELANAITNIDLSIVELERPSNIQINARVRSLLSESRAMVSRLMTDQCEHLSYPHHSACR